MCDLAYPQLNEPDPTMLGVLPFYHIYGMELPALCLQWSNQTTGAVKLLHFPWVRGMPVVIMHKFDPVELCKNIEKYKVTECLVVPPMCLLLTHHSGIIHLRSSVERLLRFMLLQP